MPNFLRYYFDVELQLVLLSLVISGDLVLSPLFLMWMPLKAVVDSSVFQMFW